MHHPVKLSSACSTDSLKSEKADKSEYLESFCNASPSNHIVPWWSSVPECLSSVIQYTSLSKELLWIFDPTNQAKWGNCGRQLRLYCLLSNLLYSRQRRLLALNYPDDNLGQYSDLKETVATNKRDDGRRVLDLLRYCNPQCFSPQCLHRAQSSSVIQSTFCTRLFSTVVNLLWLLLQSTFPLHSTERWV